MKIIIVEDEYLIANRIKRMISEILEQTRFKIIIKTSLENALAYIFTNPVDLLLLDLNLNGKDGFELLKKSVSGAFHTIVISANTNRALEAFEYGVLDFIGKPFTKERLQKALNRYDNTENRNKYPTKYLSIRTQEKLVLIIISDINYIKGAGNYSEIHLNNGQIEFHDKSLSVLETILPTNFIRTHKSYIVNIQNILHFRSLGASKYDLVLKNSENLPVSRIKYKEIRHLIP